MYGRIFDPGMECYPTRVSLALRIGVSTPCGTFLTWGTTVFVTGFWFCRCIKGFMMRGWDLILPGWR